MNAILLTIKFRVRVEKVIKLTMTMRRIASMWMNVRKITMEGKKMMIMMMMIVSYLNECQCAS